MNVKNIHNFQQFVLIEINFVKLTLSNTCVNISAVIQCCIFHLSLELFDKSQSPSSAYVAPSMPF